MAVFIKAAFLFIVLFFLMLFFNQKPTFLDPYSNYIILVILAFIAGIFLLLMSKKGR
jgi:hypothetical protein